MKKKTKIKNWRLNFLLFKLRLSLTHKYLYNNLENSNKRVKVVTIDKIVKNIIEENPKLDFNGKVELNLDVKEMAKVSKEEFLALKVNAEHKIEYFNARVVDLAGEPSQEWNCLLLFELIMNIKIYHFSNYVLWFLKQC